MPVCVPSFRIAGKVTSVAWTSVMGTLLRSRQSSPAASQRSQNSNISQRLPGIPKGTLSGVATMFGRKAPSDGSASKDNVQEVGVELGPYSELRTQDIDYHKHVA
jgi:hypothetical protein